MPLSRICHLLKDSIDLGRCTERLGWKIIHTKIKYALINKPAKWFTISKGTAHKCLEINIASTERNRHESDFPLEESKHSSKYCILIIYVTNAFDIEFLDLNRRLLRDRYSRSSRSVRTCLLWRSRFWRRPPTRQLSRYSEWACHSRTARCPEDRRAGESCPWRPRNGFLKDKHS